MKHKIVLCLIMALLLSSCMSSKKMVASMDNTDKKLNIPFVVDSISFEDKRKIVSQNGDIRLPLMSMPNEKRLFFPALSAVHQSVIETTIRENLLTSSTNTTQVVVEILDGVRSILLPPILLFYCQGTPTRYFEYDACRTRRRYLDTSS